MNIIMNEYPEVLFSILYMLICLVLIVIFALTERMKKRASLLKNGDVKVAEQKDIYDKGYREKRK